MAARRRSGARPTARSSMRCARAPTRSWPAPGRCAIERYGPIIERAKVRERRRAEGLAEQPLAVIVSRSLAIDRTVPLLADPGSSVVVLTPDGGELDGCAARIEYVRAADAARGARRAAGTLRRRAHPLRGWPVAERSARRGGADRRAVPRDRATARRRDRRRTAIIEGGAPAHARAARAARCCSRTSGSSSRVTSPRLIGLRRRRRPISRVTASSSSLASRPPSAGLRGATLIVTITSGPSTSSSVTRGWRRIGTVSCVLDRLLQLDRRPPVAQARAQADRLGLVQRADRGREHRAVGHEHEIAAGIERRVHQPERGHDALDLTARARRPGGGPCRRRGTAAP